MDVGKTLKQLRKLHNITTIELSKRCGISQSTISKLENGSRIPDVPTINEICKALNITLSDFFALDKISEPIDEYLIEIIYMARSLNREQLEALCQFLKTVVEKETGNLSPSESG